MTLITTWRRTAGHSIGSILLFVFLYFLYMFKYYTSLAHNRTKWLSSAVSVAECWSYPGSWWTWRPIMPSLSSATLKRRKETSFLNLVNDFSVRNCCEKEEETMKIASQECKFQKKMQYFHVFSSETPCGNSVSWSEDNHFTGHGPHHPMVASHAF